MRGGSGGHSFTMADREIPARRSATLPQSPSGMNGEISTRAGHVNVWEPKDASGTYRPIDSPRPWYADPLEKRVADGESIAEQARARDPFAHQPSVRGHRGEKARREARQRVHRRRSGPDARPRRNPAVRRRGDVERRLRLSRHDVLLRLTRVSAVRGDGQGVPEVVRPARHGRAFPLHRHDGLPRPPRRVHRKVQII